MNLNYLINSILPQRSKEIEEGKNRGTANPIYVVMNISIGCCSGWSDYTMNTNIAGYYEPEEGYVDLAKDDDQRKFKRSDKGMKNPERVTKYYIDRPVAFFLTSKAAHEYLEYQSHNLHKKAYVYVFHAGYKNVEMENLFSK